MQRQTHEMSFSMEPKEIEQQGIHRSLARTYKEIDQLMYDVKNSTPTDVSKYNYYGKKYRFQSSSPNKPSNPPSPRDQTISGFQSSIKQTFINPKPYLQPPIQIPTTKPSTLHYQILFKKQTPLAPNNPPPSDRKEHYLTKKIQVLEKEILTLKTQNQRLRRASIGSLKTGTQKIHQKQKRINFQKYIKDLS